MKGAKTVTTKKPVHKAKRSHAAKKPEARLSEKVVAADVVEKPRERFASAGRRTTIKTAFGPGLECMGLIHPDGHEVLGLRHVEKFGGIVLSHAGVLELSKILNAWLLQGNSSLNAEFFLAS